MKPNYFELFDIPIGFKLDESALKRKYYALSKAHHPDFYGNESKEKQEEVLSFTSDINNAFTTLSNEALRVKYVLGLFDIELDQNNALPQAFLMDMMDINESIFELQADFNPDTYANVLHQLHELDAVIQSEMKAEFDRFENQKDTQSVLENIKLNYLKSKYLLRIRENLATFAHL